MVFEQRGVVRDVTSGSYRQWIENALLFLNSIRANNLHDAIASSTMYKESFWPWIGNTSVSDHARDGKKLAAGLQQTDDLLPLCTLMLGVYAISF